MAMRALQFAAMGLMLVVGLGIVSCGGAGGGAGADGAGQGLVLTSFSEDGVANVPLNTRLEFRFSEAVDPSSIHSASLQIREGPAFGTTAAGVYLVEGSSVYFEPQLPSRCDLSDAGFRPDTQYRVQAIGFPEEFSIRNTHGQSMGATLTFEFHTRNEQDPDLFLDQIPNANPAVLSVSPDNGAEAVTVEAGNAVVLELSENVLPCSVHELSATMKMYEIGDINGSTAAPNGNDSGFAKSGDTADQTPGDPYTWGADGTTSLLGDPQTVPVMLQLEQGFHGTSLRIVPVFGKFPENALLVVELTFDIADFGSHPLVPFASNFTTENLPVQTSSYLVANEGETPYLDGITTAKVNVEGLCEGKAQGFLLFAGDGDNGSQMVYPGAPEYDAPACVTPRDVNDGSPDHFTPTNDVVLDTGSTINMCPNSVDGSTAVVWEFASLYIGPGITVNIIGVNPAIILVQGDATIDTGGKLVLKGSNGQAGKNYPSGSAAQANGGNAVAGGGKGGDAWKALGAALGEHGYVGYGSPDYEILPLGGHGAGHGNTAVTTASYTSYPCSASGGGAAHSAAGGDGTANTSASAVWKTLPDGLGGEVYPTGASVEEMLTPSAGSGGGAAGWASGPNDSTYYRVSGGAGGAGGGFVDITAAGNIRIYGTIDASGGRGGDGNLYYINRPCTGGGGGGSGGGIRLLTPLEIDVTGGALDASGGAGGTGAVLNYAGAGLPNDGGAGSNGRIVLEDSDSIIRGQGTAMVVPSDGSPGFYRGVFQALRFTGGGRRPRAVSDLFLAGPFNPQFIDPLQTYGVAQDFVVGVPVVASPGQGNCTMMIEAQGYQMKTDGTADAVPFVGWHTLGNFTDTGVENLPEWHLSQPSDLSLIPSDNVGFGITALNSCEYIQFRITYFLPATMGALDPGPWLDDWTIRFTHNQ